MKPAAPIPSTKATSAARRTSSSAPKSSTPSAAFTPTPTSSSAAAKSTTTPPAISSANSLYISTNTFIYSPGVGLDYNLTHNLALKADVQFQHWDTPAVASGVIHPIAITFGALYNFDFNPGHRHND